jgi:toxin-antitoxin system PIN domain toxin
MRCADVNVLVYAHRPESPDHVAYRAWLERARTGHEPLGLSDLVLSGFLRVVTHPRVFREPSPLDVALDFVAALTGSPAASVVTPGERHWSVFTDLCRAVGATGNVVPDAFLAALAIEQGATWVTADRSFARFPGLRWEHPLDG